MREALEALVPDEALPEFEALVQVRQELKRALPDPTQRAEVLRALLRQLQQHVLPTEVRP